MSHLTNEQKKTIAHLKELYPEVDVYTDNGTCEVWYIYELWTGSLLGKRVLNSDGERAYEYQYRQDGSVNVW